jgi:hypothetical protein
MAEWFWRFLARWLIARAKNETRVKNAPERTPKHIVRELTNQIQ